MTPEELVATACPQIAVMGSSFYFIPETTAKGKEVGLDGFRLYFLGRGGVLGATSASVVSSAFGYFNSALVAKMWDSASTTVDPITGAAIYWEACAEHGRRKLAAVDGLDDLVGAARKVVEAADPSGLALFSGMRQMPVAHDAPAQALQLVAVLREFRGSAHLVAIRSVGLMPSRAHFIQRPDMVEGFGWTADDAAAVTDEDRSKLAEAESVTDLIVTPAFAVLDDGERESLVRGLAAMGAALN